MEHYEIDKLLFGLELFPEEIQNIEEGFDRLNRVLKASFGSNLFFIGAIISFTLLADEMIEATQLLPRRQSSAWGFQANKTISEDANNGSSSSQSCEIDSSFEEVIYLGYLNTIQCKLTENTRLKVTANNICSIFLSAAFEEFNQKVGGKNLLKKSLLLIKAWCHYESRRFSSLDLTEIFNHDALVVMTMMIFVKTDENNIGSNTPFCPVDHPLTALMLFLQYFADIDWRSFRVTATGLRCIHPPSSQHIRCHPGAGEYSSTCTTVESLLTKGSFSATDQDTLMKEVAMKQNNSSFESRHTKRTRQHHPYGEEISLSEQLQSILKRQQARYNESFVEQDVSDSANKTCSSKVYLANQTAYGFAADEHLKQLCYGNRETSESFTFNRNDANHAYGFSTGNDLDFGAPPGLSKLPCRDSNSSPNQSLPLGSICVMDPIVPHLNICRRTKSALYPPKLTSQLPELLSKLMKSGLEDIQQHLQAIRSANEFDVSVMLPMCSEKVNQRSAAYMDRSSFLFHSLPNNYVDEYQGIFGNKASTPDNVTAAGASSFKDYNQDSVNQPDYPSDFLNIPVSLPANRLGQPHRSSVLHRQDEVSFSKSINTVEIIIREAELVASTKITEESVITLVNQILEQFGALPIGEIGKQLQVKTGDDDFPKLLKKGFSGLKRFITAHPNLYRFGNNHNFNPVVYRVDPEKESRASEASNASMYSSEHYASHDMISRKIPSHYSEPQQPISIRLQSTTRQLGEYKHLAVPNQQTQPSSPPRRMTQQHSFFSQQIDLQPPLNQEHATSFSLSTAVAVALKSSSYPSSSHEHIFQPINSSRQLQSISASTSARDSSHHFMPIEHLERQHSTQFVMH